MWMTDYVREVKRQLRDVYKIVPSRTVEGDEPCFDKVKDGIYPMLISGQKDWVVVSEGRFIFGLQMMAPPEQKV